MDTVVIEPVSENLPAEAHVLCRQRMIPRLHRMAPPLMLDAIITQPAHSNLRHVQVESGASALHPAVYGASILITLLGNVTLNHQFTELEAKAETACVFLRYCPGCGGYSPSTPPITRFAGPGHLASWACGGFGT